MRRVFTAVFRKWILSWAMKSSGMILHREVSALCFKEEDSTVVAKVSWRGERLIRRPFCYGPVRDKGGLS